MRSNVSDIEDKKLIIRRTEQIIEIILLTLVYFFIWHKFYNEIYAEDYQYRGQFILMSVYALLTAIIMHTNEGFRFGYLKLIDVTISQCVALCLINFITYWQLCLMAGHMITVFPMLLLTVIEMIIAFIVTYISTAIYHKFHVPLNMLMIYGTENSVLLKSKMDKRSDKYHISKIVSADISFSELISIIPEYDGVIISDISAERRNDLLKWCYANEIRTYLTPKISDVIESGAQDINLFDTPLKLVKGLGLSLGNRIAKRTIDIILSSIALLLLSPVFLIIASAIKIEDKGPVFFKQERSTIGGKKFWILKFRSMIVDAEKDGEVIPASDNDERITKVGKLIRACRLDELPQLFNIFKGDMSIVGPRPERVEHIEKYTDEIPEFQLRMKVKGGLTGMAQIYGKYNTSPLDKLKLDLMYIENYSIMLDIKLIIMTVRILFSKESTEGFEKKVMISKTTHENTKSEMQIGKSYENTDYGKS